MTLLVEYYELCARQSDLDHRMESRRRDLERFLQQKGILRQDLTLAVNIQEELR